VLRGATDLDTRYLFYALSPVAIRPYLSGSVQAKLTQRSLNRVSISWPDEEVRAAIASVLGALDDKIELNRRMNETLEALARAIFTSWFVDFDPVRAKAEGRQPVGMDAETAALFPDSFEDSPLGPIPCGWQVVPLDQLATFLNGLALQRFPATGEDDLPVIKIPELRAGVTNSTGKASAAVPEQYVVADGDVLFSWSGSLVVKLWSGGPGALNQHLFRVTSNRYPRWLYYFWIQEHLEAFRQIAAGKATTIGHIQRRHIAQALCIVPPAAIEDRATRVLEPMLAACVARAVESRSIANLRDALLPELIAGTLRVKSAHR
jgi:type I restriction enzyme S subunit